ncbi:MAG: hypothetical protein U0M70_02795 [Eubacteriales bacterium]|jgi:hypothetical protein|uniref:Uncharacterized protein n=1 Tax=Baileyella intestinalis TaxID=2606709 RepID=A0A6A8MCD9_9FIRM|nr:hypothetical protein [Baileyella intestinalis]MCI7686267.1 hypothetical protein [Clostridiales bacterium]MDD5875009.1 hypothetical protein [Baileyella intestinalis]MDY2994951.1 hypothetical protein [Baileyella intestinalis]MST69056.1 hypothetical protein [Baileyella intestinalis]
MEKSNFWKTKAGALTIGFIIAMISFVVTLVGIKMNSEMVQNLGLVLVIIAVLISPVKVFIIDRKNK